MPATRLREPLELAVGGSTDEREEEEAKERVSSKAKGERGETKNHSQSEKLRPEDKPKKTPTASPESERACLFSGIWTMSPFIPAYPNCKHALCIICPTACVLRS